MQRTSHQPTSAGTFIRGVAGLAAALSLLSSAALGQTTSTGQPPLKGPDVTDHSGKSGRGHTSGFGGDAAGKNKARPQLAPSMPDFMQALSAANLTNEQKSKARTLESEFESASKAYLNLHKAEIETARSKLSAEDCAAFDKMVQSGRPLKASKSGFKGKGGVQKDSRKQDASGKSDAAKTTSADRTAAADARAKLIEIYSGRPKAEETQSKILALLDDKQKDSFETALKQSLDDRHHGKGKARPGAGRGKA